MPRAFALRLDMPDPADASALAGAIAAGAVRPEAVRAILVKTPGNGLTNDFSRALAARAIAAALGGATAPMLLASGGAEGIAVPHMLVLGREDAPAACGQRAGGERLALGSARGAPLARAAIGTAAMAEAVAATVTAALADAGLGADATRLVIVKAPLPAPATLLCDHAALKARARGAAALGVMVALGELAAERLGAVAIGRDDSVHSARALVAAGTDILAPEALALGMAPGWGGDLVIASGTLDSMLDIAGFRAVLDAAGVADPLRERSRIAAILAKGAMPAMLAGHRLAAQDDSDIHPARHWRAAMSGIVGAVTGDLRPFLSGGGEHQGPPGGVTLAVLAHTGEE